MSLHDLRREYEERRRALIEQLQSNKNLDAATQHQIYGAIKEIENFLSTIEGHVSAQQERGISVDLSRERPSPFGQRSRAALGKVSSGTARVFTKHIPNATKALVTAPKRFVDRKREETRLRREIEAEVRARQMPVAPAAPTQHNEEYVVLEHPHQVLAAEEPSTQSHPVEELPAADAPAAQTASKKRKKAPVKVVQKSTKRPAQAVPSRKNIMMGKHPKRAKTIETPSKNKAHPSKHGKKSMGKTHGKGKHLAQAPKTQGQRRR